MSSDNHGFIFPRDGSEKRAPRRSHLGRVLIGIASIPNKEQEKEYRYLEIRVGADLLEAMGFKEGDRLQFGVNPTNMQAAVQPCTGRAGYPVRLHLKRNKSAMIHIPEAELPFPLIDGDFQPVDTSFMEGRLVFNNQPGITFDLTEWKKGDLYYNGRRLL